MARFTRILKYHKWHKEPNLHTNSLNKLLLIVYKIVTPKTSYPEKNYTYDKKCFLLFIAKNDVSYICYAEGVADCAVYLSINIFF
jgi:hypothetical protein